MKKILSVLLAVTMLLAGAVAAAETDTLTMATNAAFPPYEYYDDETGEIVGIDAEIAQAICDKLGYGLEIVNVDFDSIVPGVQSGKYTFGMAGMTVTEDRLESVDFSDSYATGIQVVIVPEDSAITSVDDPLPRARITKSASSREPRAIFTPAAILRKRAWAPSSALRLVPTRYSR